ncbi:MULTISPECIES: EAL domain-containing protein [unclassified Methylophaga]|jgi:diguanylate cyclase (GGDEF)-like protein|uniref:EAL domain-containing protein n=6 Tax=Methylophaga TaxID=40222 RepID=UPI00259C91B2|nr:EAL domain-containing protein [Methylophaga sp. UBA2513]|tara:strand:- start:5604 stop:7832 length:2229 start_codon:yes stop_codon:yes gene_type:complete
MNTLFVRDCVQTDLVQFVLDEERPRKIDKNTIFAVFNDNPKDGKFCGLVTLQEVSKHPNWIFADLCKSSSPIFVTPETPIEQSLAMLDINGQELLPVLDQERFAGVITRTAIFERIASRKQHLLTQSHTSLEQIEQEHQQLLSWSKRLEELHDRSRDLLACLATISAEPEVKYQGINALAKLVQCHSASVQLIDKHYSITDSVGIGFTDEQLSILHHCLTLHKNTLPETPQLLNDLCLECKEGSHSLSSVLMVSIRRDAHTFGYILLSEKLSGQQFDKNDELFALSFAHTLSLALDNAQKLKQVEKVRHDLDYLAHFDALTGLPNRALLTDRLQQAVKLAAQKKVSQALLFIDLDDFKRVNDSLGHMVGDALLAEVAKRLPESLSKNDTLTRFAGDEFVVLMTYINEPVDAANIAEKIISSFHQPFVIDEHEVFVSISIGIAFFNEGIDSVDQALSDADNALRHAKALGKNQYHFFSDEMNNSVQNHFELENRLRRAIADNELQLHYQPKIDIVNGDTVGFEALLRWHNAEHGDISPSIFIPIAEKSGLIVSIGEWVIDQACKQAKQWLDSGFPAHISVNLSARQFLHTGKPNKLFELIEASLNRYQLPAEYLEVEITENLMMHHLNESFAILEKLKNIGVKIFIDDFGTGYSSLSYIKKFPIHALKIDKSFIDDLVNDENDAAIVTAIIAMAKQLKLEVVVEGVETEEQLAFFRDNDYAVTVQGYYFCAPLPANEIRYIYQ